jgi:lambda family phage portal protein
MRAHSQVNREYLGLSDDAADAINRRIDFIFNAHAESKAWDSEGASDFYGQQDLALRTVLGRGDAVVVRRFVERPGDILATRFQLIEGDRLSTPVGTVDSPNLVAGVVLDEDGRRIGFHIQDQHPGDWMLVGRGTWTHTPATQSVSGEWNALQILSMRRPGQIRGVPLLAGVVELLKQASRLTENELMASVINSLFTVFIKSTTGLVDIDDQLATASGQAVEPTPRTQDPTELNLGNGNILGLATGEDISFADPKRPNVNFDPFFRAIVMQISAAIDVPFEVLMMYFTTSYTAARAAFLEFWRIIMARRRWLIRDYAGPCREAIITEAVARGLIDAPGFFTDPLARRAYCQARWTGPAMGQLNPVDETNSAKSRVAEGFSSIEAEIAQIGDGDFEGINAQRTREHKMRVAAGLEPDVLGITTRAVVAEPTPSIEPDPANPTKPAPNKRPSPADDPQEPNGG